MNMGLGVVWAVGGLLFTALTYLALAAWDGGVVVATGAIAVGALQFAIGLVQFLAHGLKVLVYGFKSAAGKKAVLRTMMVTAAADGVVGDDEVERIAEVYESVFAATLDPTWVRTSAEALRGEGLDIGRAVRKNKAFIPSEMVPMVFKASYLVAAADGVVNDAEMAVIEQVARALGMTDAEIDDGLEELRRAAQAERKVRDIAKIFHSLASAAERGEASAQFRLGTMYAEGRGVVRDQAKAAQWFNRAAQQGNAFAQNNVGLCYRDGRGVERDDAKAVSWFLRAAEQEAALAQTNLGLMYKEGRVPGGYAKAVEWLRRAADQGDAFGQANLALMYMHGHGVPVDFETAHVLLDLSVAQGFEGAAQIKNTLMAKMSSAERVSARGKLT